MADFKMMLPQLRSKPPWILPLRECILRRGVRILLCQVSQAENLRLKYTFYSGLVNLETGRGLRMQPGFEQYVLIYGMHVFIVRNTKVH